MALAFQRLGPILTGGGAALYNPTQESTLAAYFDFRDLSDGAVSTWTSRDPIPQIIAQATGTNQPVKGATGVTFDGSNDELSRTAVPIVFSSGIILPDGAQHTTAGKGFTCTGLARDETDGTWWVANHGLATGGDAGPQSPSIVHVSADFTTRLGEIDLVALGSTESVQGIAFDQSDNTIWYTDPAAMKIRHITRAGVPVGDEITLTYIPNGLARDPTDDALWIMSREGEAGAPLEKRSCVDGTLLAGLTDNTASRDMLFYHDATRSLFKVYGPNGSAGSVGGWYAPSNHTLLPYPNINFADEANAPDCIEGMYWDGGYNASFCNDAWFHTGNPALNRILQYRMHPLVSNVVDMWAVATVAAATGTDSLLSVGRSDNSNPGFGIFPTAVTGLNIIARPDTGAAASLAATVPNMSTGFRIIYVRLDFPNSTITVWVDGTQAATGAAANQNRPFSGAPAAFRLGAADLAGRNLNGVIKAAGYNMGAADRVKMEGYLAHQFGLTANLPGGHAHKTTPP